MKDLHMQLNLIQAFERGLEAFDTPRGDEATAHVSDLSQCAFSVWNRRNGKPQVTRSSKTRAMLQAGLRDEAWILARLERGIDGYRLARDQQLEANGVTGHIDAILERIDDPCERALLEIKTTEWKEEWVETGVYLDSGKPKKKRVRVPWADAPGETAIMQAFGYVQRLPKNPDGKRIPFTILQLCRASLQIAQFPGPGEWYDGDDASLLARHDQLTTEVLRATAPGVDPIAAGIAVMSASGAPAGLPREKWQCAYCSAALCPLNTNADLEAIPS